MASLIIIISPDDYIREALSTRLKSHFNHFYIQAFNSVESLSANINETILISDQIYIIYDNKKYIADDLKIEVTNLLGDNRSYSLHPLTLESNPYAIQFSQIVKSVMAVDKPLINNYTQNIDSNNKIKSKVYMLFAYTTVDKREAYIVDQLQSSMLDFKIRLNLMPDYKWPQTTFCPPYLEPDNQKTQEIGSFTKLMNDISRLGADEINLIDYCSMDYIGFMNPGPFDSGDDIFNYKFDLVLDLIDKTKDKISSLPVPTSLLVVVQDYRRSEARMLSKLADEVIVLLPREMDMNLNLINEEVNSLKKAVSSNTLFRIENK